MLVRVFGVLCAVLALAACAQRSGGMTPKTKPTGVASAPGTAAAPPPPTAVTAEQFDTTTPAERAAAAETAPQGGESRLGTTIASLGDPTDPGFWAETGLVDVKRQGRLEYPGSGKSVLVELRPSGGDPGSGTRVSLPAMRVLDAPLTDLPELVVYGG